MKRRRQERNGGSQFLPAAELRRFADCPDVLCCPFLTAQACTQIIDLCEAHAPSSTGWSCDTSQAYPQATVDMEVDKVPALKTWVLKCDLLRRIQHLCQKGHQQTIQALDDLFVIKYAAEGGQCGLQSHVDGADLSFMIALSPRPAYEGGGTSFEGLDGTLQLEQGSIVTFDAKLRHSGVPITSGVRYLLVGFCHTALSALKEAGNLTLDLTVTAPQVDPIAGTATDVLPITADLIADARKLYRLAQGSSYWLPADATPRNRIERTAKALFGVQLQAVGADMAGAEFWVQICPSAEGLGSKPTVGLIVGAVCMGVCAVCRLLSLIVGAVYMGVCDIYRLLSGCRRFHFDKDEDLLRKHDQWKHPVLSSVLYLSNHGAPTVVFETSVQSATPPNHAFVSFPRKGKHLIFSGKLLHGCPEQLALDREPRDRITLLVNLWRKKPTGICSMPSNISNTLSKGTSVILANHEQAPSLVVLPALTQMLDEDLLNNWAVPPLPPKSAFVDGAGLSYAILFRHNALERSRTGFNNDGA